MNKRQLENIIDLYKKDYKTKALHKAITYETGFYNAISDLEYMYEHIDRKYNPLTLCIALCRLYFLNYGYKTEV